MPGGSGDYKDEGDEGDHGDAVPTASWRRRPATELGRVNLGTRDLEGYEGEDGDDGDADEEEEVSQTDDGSTQNVED